MRRARSYPPSPSVPDPRRHLLVAVDAFARLARDCLGVKRIALVGSLTTIKAIPHDADVLVTIDDAAVDFDRLATAGRRFKGAGQNINLGADIFLADESGGYLGRICHYRECHPRAACRAQHCGHRDHLNDDLHVLTLPHELIAAPPLELWPRVVRRLTVPADVEALLLAELEPAG
jgi:hypothetical protein